MGKTRTTIAALLAYGLLGLAVPDLADAQKQPVLEGKRKSDVSNVVEEEIAALGCNAKIYDYEKGSRLFYECADGTGFGIRVLNSIGMYSLLFCKATGPATPTRTYNCSLESKVGDKETSCRVEYASPAQDNGRVGSIKDAVCKDPATGRNVDEDKLENMIKYVRDLVNQAVNFLR